MSQENVEVVRAGLAAWNAGDWDAMHEFYDPNVIWRPPEDWPEGGPFFGLDAVMRLFEQLRETWDADTLEPISDFIDAADRVVVRLDWRGAGHGPELHMEVTNVFTLREQRIAFQEVFWDHAKALETLGLSEQAISKENVQIVRHVVEAFNCDDPEAALAWLAPDLEWHDLPDLPDAEVNHGHTGFLRAFKQFFGELENYSVEVDEIIDHDEQIVVCPRIIGRGRGSGARFEQRVFGVLAVRNRLVVRAVWFRTREEALEAAGQSE